MSGRPARGGARRSCTRCRRRPSPWRRWSGSPAWRRAPAVDGRWLAAGVGLALAGFDLVGGLPVAARRAGEAMAAVDRLATLGAAPLPPRPAPQPRACCWPSTASRSVRPGPGDCSRATSSCAPATGWRSWAPAGRASRRWPTSAPGSSPPRPGPWPRPGACEPRDLVGLVPQAPHLLAGTIRDNLRVAAPDADDLALVGGAGPGRSGRLARGRPGRAGHRTRRSGRRAVGRASPAGWPPHGPCSPGAASSCWTNRRPTSTGRPRRASSPTSWPRPADRAVVVVTHDEAVVQRVRPGARAGRGRGLAVRSGAWPPT